MLESRAFWMDENGEIRDGRSPGAATAVVTWPIPVRKLEACHARPVPLASQRYVVVGKRHAPCRATRDHAETQTHASPIRRVLPDRHDSDEGASTPPRFSCRDEFRRRCRQTQLPWRQNCAIPRSRKHYLRGIPFSRRCQPTAPSNLHQSSNNRYSRGERLKGRLVTVRSFLT